MRRALLLLLLLSAFGCDGALRDPVGLGDNSGRPGVGGGGDGGGPGDGGSGSGGSLVGAWQVTILYQLSEDLQRHTTTWIFRGDRSCSRKVAVYSVLEDRTYTNVSSCTFVPGAGDVAITYTGNSAAVTFSWSLAGFNRNRLLLDGITYDRIS